MVPSGPAHRAQGIAQAVIALALPVTVPLALAQASFQCLCNPKLGNVCQLLEGWDLKYITHFMMLCKTHFKLNSNLTITIVVYFRLPQSDSRQRPLLIGSKKITSILSSFGPARATVTFGFFSLPFSLCLCTPPTPNPKP